ncbi:MAG: hypothetical protein QOJ95_2093 [Mycobacterium sp.]|jgi:hypothetical protein|nr:hypothetical protein [Mycobacterium sp.]
MTDMTCRHCAVTVPAGEFCGNCGATASPRRGDGPVWLRLSAYSAASGEHVLRPSVTSTIFPALPRHSRMTFRIALVGVIAVMLGSAVPMWQAALIGLVGFGLPLLFTVYLKETDAFADLSIVTLIVTAVLGIVFGVGWGLATDAAAAATDDDALGLPVSPVRLLITGLAIPLGFLLLLLAPMLVMRVWRPGVRESLNGYVIGSLGALCFVSAGSLTRLAAVLAEGPVDVDGPSPVHLVVGGAIQGVAIPLTAAAVGGAIGATLWFTPRTDSARAPRWYALCSPAPAITFGVAVYLSLGVLDLLSPPTNVEMGTYAVLAVLALYALRIVVHSILLHEEPDQASADDLILCAQCEHVVPDLAFCPRCGVAGHAASRSSRAARRSPRPVPAAS